MSEELKNLALELLNRNLTIGTVENCTMGLVGASIGSVCATPSIYKGSFVYFNDEVLKRWMALKDEVIETKGLYSSQIAMITAHYGVYMLNVDVCISVIGDAFVRGDGTNGTIWICVCKKKDGNIKFKYVKLESDSIRSKNIEKAISEALKATVEHIKDE